MSNPAGAVARRAWDEIESWEETKAEIWAVAKANPKDLVELAKTAEAVVDRWGEEARGVAEGIWKEAGELASAPPVLKRRKILSVPKAELLPGAVPEQV